MDSRTLLVRDGAQHSRSIEDIRGIDDLAAMRHDSQQTKNEAEAVEERRRTAQHVVGSQSHAVADEAGVVQKSVVREHGCFWVASAATGELQIAHIVRAESSLYLFHGSIG